MWFADECFYYCSFTTGFPSSKTSSTETLLTWATVTVSVHFYYNNKTLHAVTSRWLLSSRQTCSRRRFPHRFELLFCCETSVRVRGDHNSRFLFIVRLSSPIMFVVEQCRVLGEPLLVGFIAANQSFGLKYSVAVEPL